MPHNVHSVGLIRNQSKQTLQLPEINSSNAKQNMQQIQMDQQSMMGGGSRSRKNLGGYQHQNSYGGQGGHLQLQNQGGQIFQTQENQKLKGYYDARRQEKIQSDLTKIYMVNNVGNVVNQNNGDNSNGAILASSGPNSGVYQGRRISVGQGDNSGPLVPNHFHNRN